MSGPTPTDGVETLPDGPQGKSAIASRADAREIGSGKKKSILEVTTSLSVPYPGERGQWTGPPPPVIVVMLWSNAGARAALGPFEDRFRSRWSCQVDLGY